MIFADENTVYSFDPVCNNSLKPIVSGLKSITTLVVDPKNFYLFVSDVDIGAKRSFVYRYNIIVNTTNSSNPTVSLGQKSPTIIYIGTSVSDIAIDKKRS